MPPDSTRIKDPARLLSLLWATGEPAVLGRTGLTVPAITTAATALADTEGLAAVTMRAVAENLGVGTMSLYTHVPGKPELLELMLDRAASEVYADGLLPGGRGSWPDGLRWIAWRNWKHYLRHPWLAEVVSGRPVLGPGITGKYEAELAPLDGAGLPDVEVDLVLTAVLHQTEAAARGQIGLDRVRQSTGLDDRDWWATIGPLMATAMAGRSYPLADRIGTASSQAYEASGEPPAVLRTGLDLLIAGLQARLAVPGTAGR